MKTFEANQIKLKELENDGLLANLYFYEDFHMWVSYGYSAFLMRCYANAHGLDSIRRFSYKLQMPCCIVGEETVQNLRKVKKIEMETDSYLQVRLDYVIDKVDYLDWQSRISKNILSVEGMDINTPVSQYIPKDRFIKDGMNSFQRNTKRLLDMFAAMFALIVFSPLFLIVYLAIKFDDGGPAIFKQERIGRFGKPFYIYKFRSMRLDAESQGPQLSSSGGEGDTRLTKVGAFIRAHHLDELPQLWNVFTGDMSFIGPRPERAFFVDQIMDYDKRYAYLYQIRPGVTSYATLYNGYTDTMEKMLKRLEYDLYYLGHRSWCFDIKILAMTFFSIVFGKKF